MFDHARYFLPALFTLLLPGSCGNFEITTIVVPATPTPTERDFDYIGHELLGVDATP